MKNQIKLLIIAATVAMTCGSTFAREVTAKEINFCHAQANAYYSAGKMRNEGASLRDALVSTANAFARKSNMTKAQQKAGMKQAAGIINVVYSTKEAVPATTLSRKAKEVCLKSRMADQKLYEKHS